MIILHKVILYTPAIAFKDLLGSSIAPQVVPHWETLLFVFLIVEVTSSLLTCYGDSKKVLVKLVKCM